MADERGVTEVRQLANSIPAPRTTSQAAIWVRLESSAGVAGPLLCTNISLFFGEPRALSSQTVATMYL